MNLLEKIKIEANKKGLTLRQINEKAKLGTNAIYRWKNQTPNIESVQKVADVLGVSTDYLLGKKDHKKKTADLNDEDIIFTYEGRQIPPEDIELMKRLLRGKKE